MLKYIFFRMLDQSFGDHLNVKVNRKENMFRLIHFYIHKCKYTFGYIGYLSTCLYDRLNIFNCQ